MDKKISTRTPTFSSLEKQNITSTINNNNSSNHNNDKNNNDSQENNCNSKENNKTLLTIVLLNTDANFNHVVF